jgi:hypothetical protein
LIAIKYPGRLRFPFARDSYIRTIVAMVPVELYRIARDRFAKSLCHGLEHFDRPLQGLDALAKDLLARGVLGIALA